MLSGSKGRTVGEWICCAQMQRQTQLLLGLQLIQFGVSSLKKKDYKYKLDRALEGPVQVKETS